MLKKLIVFSFISLSFSFHVNASSKREEDFKLFTTVLGLAYPKMFFHPPRLLTNSPEVSLKSTCVKKKAFEAPAKLSVEEIATLINSANDLGQQKQQGLFSLKEASFVGQNFMGYSNQTYPILGTYDVVTCVAVAAWNPLTKSAALCHADSGTDIASVVQMIQSLNGSSENPIQVYLRGGQKNVHGSVEMVGELLSSLKQVPFMKVVSSDLCLQTASMLAIDARDGKIYTSFLKEQLYRTVDSYSRYQKMSYLTFSNLFGEKSKTPLGIEPHLTK
jgi:hypothetical protein